MDRVPSIPKNSSATELISGDGEFNVAGFKDFVDGVKLHEYGETYAVVAIMGPQSSGKSTLMNHLFHTNFKEMNAVHGRSQTTRGVWIAHANQTELPTIVLDLEGTDGLERGEDNTTFERQIATFALAFADVIIINMWCNDVGREHAANRPLLKAIFEAMLHLFGNSQKKTLRLVLRDKTKTPVDRLEKDLKKDVEKIWKTAIKPQSSDDTPLAQVFNLKVTALSHYELMEDTFKNEVDQLRSQIVHSINHAERVISFKNAKTPWEVIKGYKNLDCPSQKVMMATVRCEEIAIEKLRLFQSDKDWLVQKEAAARLLVTGFNKEISSILDRYLQDYDNESKHFEEDVSKAKRDYLMSEALKVVRPAYMNTLDHQRADALRSFEAQLKAALNEGRGFAGSVRTCQHSCEVQFDEKCGDLHDTFSYDISTMRRQLLSDIKYQWLRVRADKLPQIAQQQQDRVSAKFRSDVKELLQDGRINDVWGFIREMLKSESEASVLALSAALVEFELDGETVEQMADKLKQSAAKSAVTIFKEETKDVQLLLKIRFTTALMRADADDKGKLDAYSKCKKLLSAMAVIRLVERYDDVEAELVSALYRSHEISTDHPASQTWEKVPPEMTLISPVQCREIWNVFKLNMDQIYARMDKVKVKDKHKDKGVPRWVVMGLVVLGRTTLAAVMLSCGYVDVTLLIEQAIELAEMTD